MVRAGRMLAESANILMSEPGMEEILHEKMKHTNEMLTLPGHQSTSSRTLT